MLKSKFILLFTFFFSLLIQAQRIEDPKILSSKEIQKEQWVLQDKEKNLTLQWTSTALEISLANKGVNQDLQKTVYAKIPIKKLHDDTDEYVILTDAVQFLPTFVKVEWSQDDLEFLRVLENSAITLHAEGDVLEVQKGKGTSYKFYSTAFDRMCKFVTRFDWGLIALNRNSDNLPKMITSFDFENKIMRGTVNDIPFEVKFDVYYDQDIFSFHSFELVHAKKNKSSRKVKDKFSKYFNSTVYRYDIAEQTLNFYKNDKLVLMFGFILK
ncbi:hypothetical protein [Myroides marinus]|uniref:hypothetical protein n=1 Tax=Myroides marinus TaxID=703342 RepID=UPI002578FCC9|nr:hypothetical protein [Myroides marinus]MDM1375137.1 hypothetical protein [Myroides marinus]